MRNVNQTVYSRMAFDVADVTRIDKLVLRLKYEDGFVAYLNGVEVARDNAPAAASLTWNSGALGQPRRQSGRRRRGVRPHGEQGRFSSRAGTCWRCTASIPAWEAPIC